MGKWAGVCLPSAHVEPSPHWFGSPGYNCLPYIRLVSCLVQPGCSCSACGVSTHSESAILSGMEVSWSLHGNSIEHSCIDIVIMVPKFQGTFLSPIPRSAYLYWESPFPGMQRSERAMLTAASDIPRGAVVTSLQIPKIIYYRLIALHILDSPTWK